MDPEPLPRTSSLEPINGILPGVMDGALADEALGVFGGEAGVPLCIDGHEVLGSTARAIGVTLGVMHFKVWAALITIFAACGKRPDGRGEATQGELVRLIYGEEKGGTERDMIVRCFLQLRRLAVWLPGFNVIDDMAAEGASDLNPIARAYIDPAILEGFGQRKKNAAYRHLVSPDLQAKELAPFPERQRAHGARRAASFVWQFDPLYSKHLIADDGLRAFDWQHMQRLDGVALPLWMLFTSEKIPYRPVMGTTDEEMVEVPLTEQATRALRVYAKDTAGMRRTVNNAGKRVCLADSRFVAFEAGGGRGPSFLRVIRRRPPERHAQLSFAT